MTTFQTRLVKNEILFMPRLGEQSFDKQKIVTYFKGKIKGLLVERQKEGKAV